MRFSLGFLLGLLPLWLAGQSFFEGFETPALTDWEILKGHADLVTDPVIEGRQAIRVWQDVNASDLETILRHRTFSDDFGVYTLYTRADGPVSDADFIFQFIDINNYYFVSNKPYNTDNPELLLGKVVNGQYTEIFRQGPAADRGEWLKFQVERTCAGAIRVWVNDSLRIEVVDQEITRPGSIGLRTWEQYSYFDSITFDPERAFYESRLSAQTCSGQGVTIGPHTYTEAGSYTDTLKTIDGCDSIIYLQLAVFPSLRVDTQFSICSGTSLMVGDHAYDQPGTYTDTLSAAYGCDSIVHFTLTVTDGLVYSRDTILCPGDTLMLDRELVTAPGSYRIPYISASNCDSIIEWHVTADPYSLDLGPDITWCPDQPLTLNGGHFDRYLWSSGATTPTLFIQQAGVYRLEALDEAGCVLFDSIQVTEYCALTIYVPNIFSPNDDAINDQWRPSFSRPPVSYEVMIFDRWGNLVYSSRDPEEGWDGRKNQQLLLPGVYVWKIHADEQMEWGNLTLVR
ncbi:MAG: gliding motility-associated C-terminal domain-containing protein [Saprospiraceae bacterium]